MISGLDDDSLLEFCLPPSARTNKSIREGSMVRDLHKETKAKVFCVFEKKGGLGKDRWEKRKRKTERTEVGRLAIDRNCFRCVVKDAMSVMGISS